MVEEKLLNIMKEDLIRVISRLELDNAAQCKQLLDKQLMIIRNLSEISQMKRQLGFHIKQDIDRDPTVHEEKPISDRKAYTLHREIRGGVLEEIDAYVPEGIIRKLNLQHGDKLYATPSSMDPKEHNHYHYEVAEKGEGEGDPNRVQYDYCPVIEEAGRLVVDQSAKTGENIRYNDSLFTIILDENDVFTYKIKKGDLVDVAYYKNEISNARVIWKYHINNIDDITEKQISKRKSERDSGDIDYEQSLVGKTVLVIGNEPMKHLYKSSIEQRGGSFLWGDTNFSLDRLEVLVRKSDVCVLLLRVSGHIGMEHIKQMCKDYNIPFETTWSNGQSSVIRIAEEA